MGNDLEAASVKDPDLPDQTMTPRRAPGELGAIRLHKLSAGRHVEAVDRPSERQRQVLDAFGIETTSWSRATIS